MQLDPTKKFTSQIKDLIGDDFEIIVSSSFLYSGYTVFRNMKLPFQKQHSAEIDLIAILVTPLHEIRLVIECKGRKFKPNVIKSFSSLRYLLEHEKIITDLLAYCDNNIVDLHINFAKKLGVKLYKKEDLNKLVLPVIWGQNTLIQERIVWINRYSAVFHIEDYYLKNVFQSIDDSILRREFSTYMNYLETELWEIRDPLDQLNNSFNKSQGEFKDFTKKVCNLRKTTPKKQLYEPEDEVVQLAMLLELRHRFLNLHCIVRCSILARTSNGRKAIIERKGDRIRKSINKLCDFNNPVSKFYIFLFHYVYIWGGYTMKSNSLEELEIELISKELSISKETTQSFMDVFKEIYSSGSSLFHNSKSKLLFKYVPAAFKALGKIHRNTINQKYKGINMFDMDIENEKILEKSLVGIGGIKGLKFKYL